MKTKYIVGFDNDVIIVCKNRADAEEFYFSIIEECAYYVFYVKVQVLNWTLDKYISDLLKKAPRRFHTIYMRALWNNESGLWIREVKELD